MMSIFYLHIYGELVQSSMVFFLTKELEGILCIVQTTFANKDHNDDDNN